MRVVSSLARLYPFPVDADADLRRALAFLGWEPPAAAFVRASYGLWLLGLGLAVVCAVAVSLFYGLVTAALTLVAAAALTALPRLFATARRTRALADAPGLVGRAVLSMRLSPSPERAAEFAARHGQTTLGARLAGHVRRARSTQASALEGFGTAWAEWFPALERSLAMVVAAGSLPPAERAAALDRALTVVLDGTRDQLRSFTEEIRGPVTALYAFGILLPTALVALLPAGAAAGLGVTLPAVALVYDLFLPVVFVTASAWLLARRPATFPPPAVDRTHPDVPDRRLLAVAVGGITGLTGWVVTGLAFPPWAPPLAAVGLGVGTGLVCHFRPYLAVHDDVRAIEAELTDALSLVGRHVSNGRSVEAAVAVAATELSGPAGDLFERAVAQQRQLQIGVERAFLGDHGVLDAVPSPRVRESVAFLTVAATYGRPAGPAIRALAEHVDDLKRVETEARHSLQSVCGALQSTGALFGPLVAGATVALADGMTGAKTVALSGGETTLPWLGLAVGGYALVLPVVLPTLATGLVRGLDRALVGFRVGRALVAATVVYLGTYLLVGGVA